jgi:hypothetical protein
MRAGRRLKSDRRAVQRSGALALRRSGPPPFRFLHLPMPCLSASACDAEWCLSIGHPLVSLAACAGPEALIVLGHSLLQHRLRQSLRRRGLAACLSMVQCVVGCGSSH